MPMLRFGRGAESSTCSWKIQLASRFAGMGKEGSIWRLRLVVVFSYGPVAWMEISGSIWY